MAGKYGPWAKIFFPFGPFSACQKTQSTHDSVDC